MHLAIGILHIACVFIVGSQALAHERGGFFRRRHVGDIEERIVAFAERFHEGSERLLAERLFVEDASNLSACLRCSRNVLEGESATLFALRLLFIDHDHIHRNRFRTLIECAEHHHEQ